MWGRPPVRGGLRAGVMALLLGACLPEARSARHEVTATPPGASQPVATPTMTDPPVFEEIAAAAGLDFVHENGMSGQRYFVEMMGAGLALFDYDNDGDLDLYLAQGHSLAPGSAPPADASLGRLYRNDLGPGSPGSEAALRFTDVTEPSGIRAGGYGIGVAAGDYDRDGFVDLYLANWGSNQLWRNRGDGRFEDRTEAAGVDDPRWSSGASFVDVDRDGWLDLAVVNYTRYSLSGDHPCHSAATGRPDYCTPTAYPADSSSLFHNRGDGRFEDWSAQVGLAERTGPGLGIVAGDVDRDGWIDLLLANDGQPNQLWMNRGGGRFEEQGLRRGVGVNRQGLAEANMGVVLADLDEDCDEDLFITHYHDQMNTFWRNDGDGVFEDRTPESGLGFVSLPDNGFGAVEIDFDNDGRLDLFTANGDVTGIPAQVAAGDPLPLKQRDRLYRNFGAGRFEDRSDRAGDAFAEPAVGRGAAGGDLDNDGDLDLVVAYNHGPVRLLRNRIGQDAAWIGLRLVEGDPIVDSLSARVELRLTDGRRLCRRVRVDGSYASAQDPRVLIGLGRGGQVAEARVTWPDGQDEGFGALETGRYQTLRRGEGGGLP
ncbi:MAG: CRTAC1 family protein [Caldilineae bacterium]|nr:CRTAC1 family protein [Chloroflexota bacterium]MCB9176261.1 CRTAC1 family protein [Caldilineae bacterium]